MNPLRLSVRFALQAPVGDLEPAIGVFHRMIQYGRFEGLVLDVADYRHVPDGPGVMLVGHEVDYAISENAFTVSRKRRLDDDVQTQLRDALRMGVVAMDAIDHDGALTVAFDRARFTVSVLDRRLGSRGQIETALESAVSTVINELVPSDAALQAVAPADPRTAPEISVEVAADEAGGLLAKLGGSRAPGQSPWDITVEELARLRGSDEDFVLLDVREESEYETVNLGGTLMPLATIGERLGELDRSAKVVVHCRAGRRGATAVGQLREAGFEDAWNVNGALMSWIDRIDPSLARY